MKKVFYIIKNILFLPFLVSLYILFPNIKEMGIIGIIFLSLTIIYIIMELLSFLIQEKELKYKELTNIMSSLIYVYLSLIAYRYYNVSTSLIYEIDSLYFKINYLLLSVGMIAIMINICLVIKNLNKRDYQC